MRSRVLLQTVQAWPYSATEPGQPLRRRFATLSFPSAEIRALFDHGGGEFIYSVHLVKTLLAAIALAEACPAAAPTVLAALNRFLHALIKSRHILRTARQMRAFVKEE